MAYWRQSNQKVSSLLLTTYLPPPAGMWHWKIGDFNAIYSEAENICANKPSLDELWAKSLTKFRKEPRTSTKRLSRNSNRLSCKQKAILAPYLSKTSHTSQTYRKKSEIWPRTSEWRRRFIRRHFNRRRFIRRCFIRRRFIRRHFIDILLEDVLLEDVY